MDIPLQITGRNFDLTDSIKAEITKETEKLGKFYSRIMNCRVVVESPHRHHHSGRQYSVHIVINVPGSELVTKRDPHKDLYVAIRDSFKTARRELEDYARLQRGD